MWTRSARTKLLERGSEGNRDFGVHDAILGEGGDHRGEFKGLDELPDRFVIASLLPLKIEGCDGSPIRAVAWVKDEE